MTSGYRQPSRDPGLRPADKDGGRTYVQNKAVADEPTGDFAAIDPHSGVKRGLKTRHLSMMALAGIIGPGLLVGSGGALSDGGPAALVIGFGVIGIIAFSIMQSLGELTTLYPSGGAFVSLADRFVDKAFGVAVGWNYFIIWLAVLANEYNTITSIFTLWSDKVPIWGYFLMFWFAFTAFQLLGVEAFGEAEFWLALLKLGSLVAYFLFSIIYVGGGIKNVPALGGKYWHDPGALPHGFRGVATVFVFCSTFYAGVESVAVAATETKNPGVAVPLAIRQVFWRILFIYMGSAIFFGLTCPSNASGLINGGNRALKSPMTIAIQTAGWHGGQHLINAFILVTCLSAVNSSIYIGSRTLLFMAQDGKAPRLLGRTNSRGVPIAAVLMTNACGALSMMNVSTGASSAYSYIVNLSGVSTFLVWGSISFTHIRFRAAWKAQGHTAAELPFRSFLYPWNAYFGLGANAFLALVQGWTTLSPFRAGKFVDSYILLPLFAVIYVVYKLVFRTRFWRAGEVDLVSGRRRDVEEDKEIAEGQVEHASLRLGAAWLRKPGAMLSRSSSMTLPVAGTSAGGRRLSVSSRISFAVSSAERGESEVAPAAAAEHQMEEEIAEIKRYEDAAREQQRRKTQRQHSATLYDNGQAGWRYRLWEWYDAGQGWIVVTLIGAAIGLNAAFLNIVTEWLSDIKMGYCTTAFYLNESFCCWGADNGCADWHRWTVLEPANYVLYLAFAVVFAWTSATLVRSFAPYAAGSGISEIKCIIAGFTMKGFLGPWTLAIKSVALPLAIASGLSVGKEGPSVHYAVCTGAVISRFFGKYRHNASKTREILCACAAAGVAVAFGSPIGGVLFSLEEMATYFPLKTVWRSYFCALVATAVLAAMNPFRTGQLVMFQVHYDRSWHFFETAFYVLIGVFGGLYGAFVIKWNLRAQAFRKKYLARHAVLEATLLAAATALVCYPNVFLRIDMTESMEILFLECEGAEDYQGLCDAPNRAWNIASLVVATVLRILLVIISYGCKVPAGIFVPSMAIGASFGRTVGIVVQALHERYPASVFFAACEPDVPCITPGTYAFLGAAAALSGIMHLTVSVVVIMFELTGALTYILPTMIVVGVTKAASDLFGGGGGGIADRMISFSGFPFLDNKEEHNFGVSVAQAMTSDVVALPAAGMTLAAVEQLLARGKYQGFPVVDDVETRVLAGYVGRTELRYALERLRSGSSGPDLHPDTRCHFLPEGPVSPDSTTADSVDLGRFVDRTPVTAHPRLPLETVMELFQKIGPRVILIEYRGRLSGLVTVKDCLKYQFKAEAAEHARDDGHAADAAQEQLWAAMRWLAVWLADRLHSLSGGRIRLGGSDSYGELDGRRSSIVFDGTEGFDDDGVELADR
ncbi:voltage-gated chloride channel protein [Grosmannia clavigera kw1407]|uniref:Chloride channel protein n=1 Tax=Grosmannia clavigera (strain kw1407 / UAMH 11150) TaxID=655863 RepID=F0XHY0_GROCL|nr:voltage-gated chloride channel protein [Grosmannia clavigera kw1407]EFX02890.1 voltage-gated chloride channel protein [Grosmannia clavigera kw1407]